MKKIFSNIVIPQIVYYEFRSRLGDEKYRTIKSLRRSKFVLLEDFEVGSPEHKLYKKLKKGIECSCRGRCESAAITIAKYRNYTILSNNDCECVHEYNLDKISVIETLQNAYDNEMINIDEEEIIWSNIKKSNQEIINISFKDYISMER